MAEDRRIIPEETPIAFSYEGVSYAVMMATPEDLEDFAVGFSLSEGVISSAEEIGSLEVVATDDGILLRMSLGSAPSAAFWRRRRYLAGPSGCGLCGLETLAQAVRRPPAVTGDLRVAGDAIVEAMAALPGLQPMNRLTGALHAAAFWTPQDGIVAVREDVGRHNALDKLIGAGLRAGVDFANGICVLTSRCSFEMAQKASIAGMPVLAAISAPTALAIRTADAAGLTLIGFARGATLSAYAGAWRIPELTTEPASPGR